MKQLLFLLFGLATIPAATAQVKKPTDTKIDKVTVFLEGAKVQRSALVPLTGGKQELIFHDISPDIDKQSIQVKTADNITIVSVIHQADHLREQKKNNRRLLTSKLPSAALTRKSNSRKTWFRFSNRKKSCCRKTSRFPAQIPG